MGIGFGFCCCGMPLVMISTCDSSVSYTYLCPYENAEGDPGSSCADGWSSTDPEGSCVYDPIQKDKDKWNEDVSNWNDARAKWEKHWPVAGGIISGGYRCWAGVKEAIWPYTETWISDTYGEMEFARGGYDGTDRITLNDLQTMFLVLHAKHELEEDDQFGLLMVIDNTGSISTSQWETNAQTDFTDWIEEHFPKCRVKIITLSNYLVDGEDWVRHFGKYYEETAKKGI